MGLIIATITRNQLMARKHDLEAKIIEIKQAKLTLSSSMDDLLNVGTDLDPENPMTKQLEQRKARLNLLEKKLGAQLEEYQLQLEMIEKNLEGCETMIKSSIK